MKKSIFGTWFKTVRKKHRKLKRIARKIRALDPIYSSWDETLLVEIGSIDELTAIRGRLREALGSWTDKVEQIWTSSGTACVSWLGLDCPCVKIRLTDIPFDDSPESLKKPGCGFKEVERTETVYACEISDD